jgi:predicted transcriptional regulator
MKIKDIIKALEAEVVSGDDSLLDKKVVSACGSDLMSDVLSFIKPGALLLTGLTNAQVVRTAEMADIPAICFVRGKQPPEETIKLAKEKRIVLLSTRFTMYESCGILYTNTLPPCVINK